MSFRDGPFQDLKVPLAWTAAAALVLALIIAAALVLTDRRDSANPAYAPPRAAFDRSHRPVAAVLSAPIGWVRAGVEGVRGYFFAVSENRRLKAQIRDLRHTADLAVALQDDDTRLRAILGMHTDPPIPMVAGRTVLDARGPFARTRLLNVGREKDVQIGNPVMNERGLVGRIVGVTDGASRVLLLSDVASRTPVLIDRTDARAILTGDGGPNPKLAYMRGANPVREGDRVLTSGDGGVFPRGLPVGVAAKGLDGQWRVSLNADLSGIDYVQVLKFKDFTQLVKLAELDRLRMPPPTAGVSTPAETVRTGAAAAATGSGGGGEAARAPAKTGAGKTSATKTTPAKASATAGSKAVGVPSDSGPASRAASAKTPASHEPASRGGKGAREEAKASAAKAAPAAKASKPGKTHRDAAAASQSGAAKSSASIVGKPAARTAKPHPQKDT